MEAWKNRLYTNYSTNKGRSDEILSHSKKPNEYFKKIIRTHLPKDKTISILDLACGYGSLIKALKEENYQNVKGIDISKEEVEIAKKMGLKDIEQYDIFDFLKRNKVKYDIIFVLDILEHLSRQELFELLDLIYSNLNTNGKIIIQVPNGAGIFGMRLRYGDLTHEICFTKYSMIQCLNATNFSSIKVDEVRPLKKGIKGYIRYYLWQFMVFPFRMLLYLENGQKKNVITQNMLITAIKSN